MPSKGLKNPLSLITGLSLALVQKHVKISVDEWIMETTRPHKHVQIPEN